MKLFWISSNRFWLKGWWVWAMLTDINRSILYTLLWKTIPGIRGDINLQLWQQSSSHKELALGMMLWWIFRAEPVRCTVKNGIFQPICSESILCLSYKKGVFCCWHQKCQGRLGVISEGHGWINYIIKGWPLTSPLG